MKNILENFKILDSIVLLDIDHSPPLIYDRLSRLKKEVYRADEKIVIIHKDTEYFYFDHPTGFNLYNLLCCWRDLDIPYSVMLLCSTYYDLNSAVDPFIVNKHDRPIVIDSLLNHQSYGELLNELPGIQFKNIQYPSACLLGRPRAHRIKILQFLQQHNLLNLVKTNFNSHNYRVNHPTSLRVEADFSKLPEGLSTALYSKPHRVNQNEFSQSMYQEIVDLNKWSFEDRSDPCLSENFYQETFMEIVSESMFSCPHSYFSEKVFKPIVHRTPFLFFGPAYSLKRLHKHGFKTFSDFWNEDYDNESDHHLRFLKCCHTMQEIVTQPLEDLIKMYSKMQDIVNYNYIRLIEYIDQEYKLLHKQTGL